MNPFRTLACSIAVALLFAGSAHAAYLYDWAQAQKITDSTPDSSGLSASANITNAWHGYTEGTHFFRLDLGGTIDTNIDYGIYIDSKAGGGTTIPASNIDYYLLSDYVKATWDATESRWINKFSSTSGQSLFFQSSQNDGKTLEWKITPNGEWDFGTSFNWLAATTSDGGQLLDKTQVAATPIPGAVWLLGSGILGLVGMKRRKNVAALT